VRPRQSSAVMRSRHAGSASTSWMKSVLMYTRQICSAMDFRPDGTKTLHVHTSGKRALAGVIRGLIRKTENTHPLRVPILIHRGGTVLQESSRYILYEHQRWAIDFLGLRKFDECVDKHLSVYIDE
jgi:hypothetical protein